MLKKVIFVTAVLYTFVLLTVCLINLNQAPKIGVRHVDKIFHFLAYCVLTLLWVYTFILNFKWSKKKAVFIGGGAAILFGIFIEVLQGSVTTTRAFDYYDILANSLGALITALVLAKKQNYELK